MFFAGDICKYQLNEIFAASVFFNTSIEAQYRALWLLTASKNFLAIYLLFLSNLLNTCLAWDLILMIKYPFKVKEKRLTRYLCFSIGMSALICFAWITTIDYREMPPSNFKWPMPNMIVVYVSVAILLSYFLIALYSVTYAIKSLCRSTIS
jgi:hypothetical protein